METVGRKTKGQGMNPDNPNFRTPEEEARAAEFVRLKAEVELLRYERSQLDGERKSAWEIVDLHEATIARQARVIEKLKASLEWYANATEFEISGDETGEPLADGVPFTTVAKSILKEIEQGEGL